MRERINLNTVDAPWIDERKKRLLSLKKRATNFDLVNDLDSKIKLNQYIIGRRVKGRVINSAQFGKVVNIKDFDDKIFISLNKANNQIGLYLSGLVDEIQKNIKTKFEHTKNNQREIEMNWIANNISVLTNYKGQWICIEKNHMIESNKSLKLLLKSVREKGITMPFVYFLPIGENTDHSIGL